MSAIDSFPARAYMFGLRDHGVGEQVALHQLALAFQSLTIATESPRRFTTARDTHLSTEHMQFTSPPWTLSGDLKGSGHCTLIDEDMLSIENDRIQGAADTMASFVDHLDHRLPPALESISTPPPAEFSLSGYPSCIDVERLAAPDTITDCQSTPDPFRSITGLPTRSNSFTYTLPCIQISPLPITEPRSPCYSSVLSGSSRSSVPELRVPITSTRVAQEDHQHSAPPCEGQFNATGRDKTFFARPFILPPFSLPPFRS